MPDYNYVHYFSCNFEVHSNLAGETPEETAQLHAEALSILKAIVEKGTPFLEHYDTETTKEN